ncbi:hypothetical protein DERP_002159 [Dermatophagoides pteronyssinus]|uniref:Uncharacterized protein n=1 Tax=Dermatophagoides pteronyssinus TaxID=6956 RepID=A0ABQ8JGZ6_DERPT|nr:hypothetical protein DERP_002159 [Dermatophagoides pteronyssinus]
MIRLMIRSSKVSPEEADFRLFMVDCHKNWTSRLAVDVLVDCLLIAF